MRVNHPCPKHYQTVIGKSIPFGDIPIGITECAMASDTPITAARRKALARWIKERFDGVQAAFIASTKDASGATINQGELSALLKNKSFGEKRARALEVQAGMPDDYLVRPEEFAQLSADDLAAYSVAQQPGIAQLFNKLNKKNQSSIVDMINALIAAQDGALNIEKPRKASTVRHSERSSKFPVPMEPSKILDKGQLKKKKAG